MLFYGHTSSKNYSEIIPDLLSQVCHSQRATHIIKHPILWRETVVSRLSLSSNKVASTFGTLVFICSERCMKITLNYQPLTPTKKGTIESQKNKVRTKKRLKVHNCAFSSTYELGSEFLSLKKIFFKKNYE